MLIRIFVVYRSMGAAIMYTEMRSCHRREEWFKGRAIFWESVAVEIDACGDLLTLGGSLSDIRSFVSS